MQRINSDIEQILLSTFILKFAKLTSDLRWLIHSPTIDIMRRPELAKEAATCMRNISDAIGMTRHGDRPSTPEEREVEIQELVELLLTKPEKN